VFCKSIHREIPAKIVKELERTVAFEDISPKAPVHLLIIPKDHIPSVLDLKNSDAAIVGEMMALAKDCAKSAGIDQTGFRLIFNCGPDAGQAVDHLHMHLLGRRKLSWPPG
jgi:histidine triad (HIT) family protein